MVSGIPLKQEIAYYVWWKWLQCILVLITLTPFSRDWNGQCIFFFFSWGHDRRVSAVIAMHGLRTDCVQCREWKCGSVADRWHSRLGSVPLSIVACIRRPSRSRGVGVLWSVAWTVSVVSTPCWREEAGRGGERREAASQPAAQHYAVAVIALLQACALRAANFPSFHVATTDSRLNGLPLSFIMTTGGRHAARTLC